MQYRFSVCICTRNRPDELRRALRSVEKAELVHETIVSDDSTDDRTERLVRSEFPDAVYLAGPRRGLAANRNRAVRAVTGSHVLFMDDDVELAPDFFPQVLKVLKDQFGRHGHRVIVTGLENKRGALIHPHEQSFFGFQQRRYGAGEPLRTIVINSAVFPVFLFKELAFDEQLVYGYEEVDFATRAARRGYAIVLAEQAVNDHYPSEVNRDFYRPHIVKSRLYVTLKRYWHTERKRGKALSFVALAPVHALLHGLKSGGMKGAAGALQAIAGAVAMMLRARRKTWEVSHGTGSIGHYRRL